MAFCIRLCCRGLLMNSAPSTPYTLEQLQMQYEASKSKLPRAELMNGGIIKLTGMESFFYNGPLLDPKWLKDRITPEEYQGIVQTVVSGVLNAMVGLPNRFSPRDIPQRHDIAATGAENAVKELNAVWNSKGVFMEFARGKENVQIQSMQMHRSPGMHHHHYNQSMTTKQWEDSFLYIRIDDLPSTTN